MTIYQSFDYDRTYFPAFPVLEMLVISQQTGRQQAVRGLIDSGSDATQIPLHILQSIGAREIDERWVRDYYGTRHPIPIFDAKLQIGSLVFPSMDVIGRRGTDEILIGRDLLNQMIVTLNGLAYMTEISD